MLSRWSIANFKSFRSLPQTDLGKLTILAGANSSGKSTIIQTILLLKQTLQYGPEGRSLSLNGPILRLGSYDDVKSTGSGTEPIRMAFEFDLRRFRQVDASSQSLLRKISASTSGELDEAERLLVELEFDHENHPTRGQDVDRSPSIHPNLRLVKLRTIGSSDGDDVAPREMVVTRQTRNDHHRALRLPWLFKGVSVDEQSKEEVLTGKYDAEIVGASVAHFLPSFLLIDHNVEKQRAATTVDFMFRAGTSLIHTVYSTRQADHLLPRKVVELIAGWLKAHSLAFDPKDVERVSAGEVREALLPVLPRSSLSGLLGNNRSSQLRSELGALRDSVLELMMTEASAESEFTAQMPKVLGGTSDLIQEYFRHGVHYLGPLRDSPRPVYQLESFESYSDVGYRGENTAAVLEFNRDQKIEYIGPPGSGSSEAGKSGEKIKGSLQEAVVKWLGYLGVARDLSTSDAGVFGHRLQVSTDDSGKMHDLTNVGVGISQVLPVLVMSLIAGSGTLLIFEQPELHLHPKVQSRLGDFFLSLAMNNKQVVVETHSEYLINRLRLRIAESSTTEFLEAIRILFVSRMGEESKVTPIEVNEFGSIANWPAEFFDQSDREASDMIRAAVEKKNRVRS